MQKKILFASAGLGAASCLAVQGSKKKLKTPSDVLSATLIGATIGLLGGITIDYFSSSHASNKELPLITDDFDPYNVKIGNGMEFSESFAVKIAEKYFGKLPWVRNIYINKDNPKVGLTMVNGCLIYNRKKYINGDTIMLNGGFESDVYLSRTAFTSMNQLKLTIGHEFIHCTQNYMYFSGVLSLKDMNAVYPGSKFPMAELAAYNWEANMGFNDKYLRFNNELGKFDWRNKIYYSWLNNVQF
ncbi:MAG: hypothetical protein IKR41_08335 [Bacteroidales bacterium]|nr:hypothetical protein [Bacteroidales bacterium]